MDPAAPPLPLLQQLREVAGALAAPASGPDAAALKLRGLALLAELKGAARGLWTDLEAMASSVEAENARTDAHYLLLQNVWYLRDHVSQNVQRCQTHPTPALEALGLAGQAAAAAGASARAAFAAADKPGVLFSDEAHTGFLAVLQAEMERRKAAVLELERAGKSLAALQAANANKARYVDSVPGFAYSLQSAASLFTASAAGVSSGSAAGAASSGSTLHSPSPAADLPPPLRTLYERVRGLQVVEAPVGVYTPLPSHAGSAAKAGQESLEAEGEEEQGGGGAVSASSPRELAAQAGVVLHALRQQGENNSGSSGTASSSLVGVDVVAAASSEPVPAPLPAGVPPALAVPAGLYRTWGPVLGVAATKTVDGTSAASSGSTRLAGSKRRRSEDGGALLPPAEPSLPATVAGTHAGVGALGTAATLDARDGPFYIVSLADALKPHPSALLLVVATRSAAAPGGGGPGPSLSPVALRFQYLPLLQVVTVQAENGLDREELAAALGGGGSDGAAAAAPPASGSSSDPGRVDLMSTTLVDLLADSLGATNPGQTWLASGAGAGEAAGAAGDVEACPWGDSGSVAVKAWTAAVLRAQALALGSNSGDTSASSASGGSIPPFPRWMRGKPYAWAQALCGLEQHVAAVPGRHMDGAACPTFSLPSVVAALRTRSLMQVAFQRAYHQLSLQARKGSEGWVACHPDVTPAALRHTAELLAAAQAADAPERCARLGLPPSVAASSDLTRALGVAAAAVGDVAAALAAPPKAGSPLLAGFEDVTGKTLPPPLSAGAAPRPPAVDVSSYFFEGAPLPPSGAGWSPALGFRYLRYLFAVTLAAGGPERVVQALVRLTPAFPVVPPRVTLQLLEGGAGTPALARKTGAGLTLEAAKWPCPPKPAAPIKDASPEALALVRDLTALESIVNLVGLCWCPTPSSMPHCLQAVLAGTQALLGAWLSPGAPAAASRAEFYGEADAAAVAVAPPLVPTPAVAAVLRHGLPPLRHATPQAALPPATAAIANALHTNDTNAPGTKAFEAGVAAVAEATVWSPPAAATPWRPGAQFVAMARPVRLGGASAQAQGAAAAPLLGMGDIHTGLLHKQLQGLDARILTAATLASPAAEVGASARAATAALKRMVLDATTGASYAASVHASDVDTGSATWPRPLTPPMDAVPRLTAAAAPALPEAAAAMVAQMNAYLVIQKFIRRRKRYWAKLRGVSAKAPAADPLAGLPPVVASLARLYGPVDLINWAARNIQRLVRGHAGRCRARWLRQRAADAAARDAEAAALKAAAARDAMEARLAALEQRMAAEHKRESSSALGYMVVPGEDGRPVPVPLVPAGGEPSTPPRGAGAAAGPHTPPDGAHDLLTRLLRASNEETTLLGMSPPPSSRSAARSAGGVSAGSPGSTTSSAAGGAASCARAVAVASTGRGGRITIDIDLGGRQTAAGKGGKGGRSGGATTGANSAAPSAMPSRRPSAGAVPQGQDGDEAALVAAAAGNAASEALTASEVVPLSSSQLQQQQQPARAARLTPRAMQKELAGRGVTYRAPRAALATALQSAVNLSMIGANVTAVTASSAGWEPEQLIGSEGIPGIEDGVLEPVPAAGAAAAAGSPAGKALAARHANQQAAASSPASRSTARSPGALRSRPSSSPSPSRKAAAARGAAGLPLLKRVAPPELVTTEMLTPDFRSHLETATAELLQAKLAEDAVAALLGDDEPAGNVAAGGGAQMLRAAASPAARGRGGRGGLLGSSGGGLNRTPLAKVAAAAATPATPASPGDAAGSSASHRLPPPAPTSPLARAVRSARAPATAVIPGPEADVGAVGTLELAASPMRAAARRASVDASKRASPAPATRPSAPLATLASDAELVRPDLLDRLVDGLVPEDVPPPRLLPLTETPRPALDVQPALLDALPPVRRQVDGTTHVLPRLALAPVSTANGVGVPGIPPPATAAAGSGASVLALAAAEAPLQLSGGGAEVEQESLAAADDILRELREMARKERGGGGAVAPQPARSVLAGAGGAEMLESLLDGLWEGALVAAAAPAPAAPAPAAAQRRVSFRR